MVHFPASPTLSQPEASARDATSLRHRFENLTACQPRPHFLTFILWILCLFVAPAQLPSCESHAPPPQRPPQPLFHSCRLVFIRGSFFSLSPNITIRSVSEGRSHTIEVPLQPIYHNSTLSQHSFCGFCASLWLRPNCRRASPIPRPHSVHHNHFFIRVDWCSFVVLFSASPLTSQSEVSARDDPTPLRYRCSPSNTTALFPCSFCGFCAILWP